MQVVYRESDSEEESEVEAEDAMAPRPSAYAEFNPLEGSDDMEDDEEEDESESESDGSDV